MIVKDERNNVVAGMFSIIVGRRVDFFFIRAVYRSIAASGRNLNFTILARFM